jgi:hypothetical protein
MISTSERNNHFPCVQGLSERAFFYRCWGLPKIRLTVKTAFLKKALQLTYYLMSPRGFFLMAMHVFLSHE